MKQKRNTGLLDAPTILTNGEPDVQRERIDADLASMNHWNERAAAIKDARKITSADLAVRINTTGR